MNHWIRTLIFSALIIEGSAARAFEVKDKTISTFMSESAKQVVKNYCADRAPKTLEASPRVDCGKVSGGLDRIAGQLKALGTTAGAESDVEKTRREYMFYKAAVQDDGGLIEFRRQVKDQRELIVRLRELNKNTLSALEEFREVTRAIADARIGKSAEKAIVDRVRKTMKLEDEPVSEGVLQNLENGKLAQGQADQLLQVIQRSIQANESSLKSPALNAALAEKNMQAAEKAVAKTQKEIAAARTGKPDARMRAVTEKAQLGYSKMVEGAKSNPGFGVCNLDPAEEVAIYQYTYLTFVELNKALRAGTAGDLDGLTKTIESGLKKITKFDGVVYRGARISDEDLAKHSVGSVVEYPSFTSSSLSEAFVNKHQSKIHSKNGRYIGPYSNRFAEEEVLFVPKTRFKILGRSTRPDGTIDIEMEEVE